jgi:hypothetical protein
MSEEMHAGQKAALCLFAALAPEVPADDIEDTHLKQPNVVAVPTYAAQDRIVRAVLLTCSDTQQAQLLRSTRTPREPTLSWKAR